MSRIAAQSSQDIVGRAPGKSGLSRNAWKCGSATLGARVRPTCVRARWASELTGTPCLPDARRFSSIPWLHPRLRNRPHCPRKRTSCSGGRALQPRASTSARRSHRAEVGCLDSLERPSPQPLAVQVLKACCEPAACARAVRGRTPALRHLHGHIPSRTARYRGPMSCFASDGECTLTRRVASEQGVAVGERPLLWGVVPFSIRAPAGVVASARVWTGACR